MIASGPSLTQKQVDYAVKSPAKIIAINNNYEICPTADVLYGCDKNWWQTHKGAPNFLGYKFSLQDSGFSDVHQLYNSGTAGIDFDWPNIRTGKNSGYQAINLAVHFGCRRIILVGYDMQHTDGKKHWHPNHPAGLCNFECVKSCIDYYDDLAPVLDGNDIEVLNCTLKTALKCFKTANIKDVL